MTQIIDINVLKAAHTIRCEMESERKKAEENFKSFLKNYPQFSDGKDLKE